ncbi:MAG: TonB-dependent receptor [Flavipsychrobacter sp.]
MKTKQHIIYQFTSFKSCLKVALFFICLSALHTTKAQNLADTLKGVDIIDKAKLSNDDRVNKFSPGQKKFTIDKLTLSAYQFQDMGNLLSQQVPVFVKSYGVNNLATVNFRGSSAAQSQVFWNGVPIQNAALGIADVSLLPVSLMDKVNVVLGSSSALWGSGNVGGALLVENDLPRFQEEAHSEQSASAVVGSFQQYRIGLSTSLATKKLVLSLKLFSQSAQNNFPYTKAGQDLRMDNAGLRSGVGLFQLGYKINAQQKLGLKVWYQQYYREIPPALFEAFSVKNQRDESVRLLLDWGKDGKLPVYAKLSYIRDYMHYQDTVVLLNSKNITNQVFAEVGIAKSYKGQHHFKLFAPVHMLWMQRVQRNDTKTQNRVALAAAYAFNNRKGNIELAANLRGEAVNNNSFLLPGISASYAPLKWLSLGANVQRTYRVPTLNELYYVPGGNEKLKPEQGWTQSVGYNVTAQVEKLKLQHGFSVFNRQIDDWILWFGGAIWTPHNIASVHSRGIETENKLLIPIRKLKLHLKFNGAYTLATTVSSYQPNDGSIGKQIPYTPRYTGQANIGFTWKMFYVNYNHVYTGVRYITTDQSFALESYVIGNLQLVFDTEIKDHALKLIAYYNNIWNTDYMVVNGRPMPGANWMLGVNFSFL